MHRSDDPTRQSTFVTTYVDESSTDDKVLPDGVLGAMVTNKSGFTLFDPAWSDMLERHHVEPPLHMNEFGQHGKLCHFDACQREYLIREAVGLINHYKIMSFTVRVGNRQFEACIDPVFRAKHSVYALAFIALVALNHRHAEKQNFHERIAYMFDEGNSKKEHVLRAHATFRKTGDDKDLRLGSLTFEYDTFVTALQAADVLAWAKRRLASGLSFPKGFESLHDLFTDENHIDVDVSEDLLRQLNDSFKARVARESEAAGL